MKIQTYKDIEVSLIRKTESPLELVCLAAGMTIKQDFMNYKPIDKEKLIKSLIDMNHLNPFEHINYTFLIKGSSRAYLSQVTRHRIMSPTSASQHYQDYSNYGAVINEKYKIKEFEDGLNQIMESYKDLLNKGIPKEEARMILPNAMQNNLILTWNARSLLNYFNLRLCQRNVEEMQIVSKKMYDLCLDHFPEYFKNIGPDCKMLGKCSQGRLSCKNKNKFKEVKKHGKKTY